MKFLGSVLLVLQIPLAAIAQDFSEYIPKDVSNNEFIVAPNLDDIPSAQIQKIVGTNDLQKLSEFSPSHPHFALSQKIAVVFFVSGGSCSGSLVGPDLLLTNEHCAFRKGKPTPLKDIVVSFEYYGKDYDIKKVLKKPVYFATELLKYNKKLDYALYRLNKDAGNQRGWLRLESNNQLINRSSAVKIIQHPAGRSKEIALKNTGLYKKFMSKGVVHYFADTEPGSSGSPVFSANGDSIVALHHAGYNDKKGNGLINEGILAANIYQEIGHLLP
ncbi:MAG: V8-like Glu-specific endopeptidase, partial [Glaciecola sp.]